MRGRLMSIALVLSHNLLAGNGCSNGPVPGGANDEAFLTSSISWLESLRKEQPSDERPAYDAAIDALRRLKEHHGWPVVNTPTEQGYLSGIWIRDGNADGYREELCLGPQCWGQWDRDAGAIPFSFAWLIEGKRLRLLTQDYYREAFNYQILERTYEYELSGNRLVLRRNGEALKWTRAPK